MVRLSSAVWAIIGVCEFENTVPFCLRKFSRCGICSRSEGTFGLSRAKWTLSKTMLITCEMPLPRLQEGRLADVLVPPTAVGLAEAGPDATTSATSPATTASSAAIAPKLAFRRAACDITLIFMSPPLSSPVDSDPSPCRRRTHGLYHQRN